MSTLTVNVDIKPDGKIVLVLLILSFVG